MTSRISAVCQSLLLAGCALSPQSPSPPVAKATPVTFPTQKKTAPPEVVHTARYTLVNLTTDDSLRFPLRQIVSHTLPATRRHSLTREEALRRWLRGTGYGLCLAVTPAMKLFYASPLPDAQRRMGPVRMEQALQTIAGSAWEMTTDEVSRTVCWQPSPASY